MLIWIWQWLSLMLTLMSLSSIPTFYNSFSEVLFTLTDGNVNVDSVSTRAYISQCKGKQLLNLQTVMLMSYPVFPSLMLIATCSQIIITL